MPGLLCLSGATDGKRFYYVNQPRAVTPDGYGQARTIREIWKEDQSANNLAK